MASGGEVVSRVAHNHENAGSTPAPSIEDRRVMLEFAAVVLIVALWLDAEMDCKELEIRYSPPTLDQLQRAYKRHGKDLVNEANRLAKANDVAFSTSLRIRANMEPKPRRRFEDW